MYERLLDRNREPSLSELAAYCGENGERFVHLNDYLSMEFGASQEVRFPYGSKYGWCVTHRKGRKLICDVFAEKGAFTVMLRLADTQFMLLYAGLTEYTRKCIDARYPCGSGGWIHYRVTDDGRLNDIKRLLNAKCR
ncbi:MAG: DUF3788 domain-containing protein [Clostridia bacterium]|nr:DUF3788 domain-containing protein [Clostridia bacterium]